jgi:putative DNA primase/helicase
VSDEKETPGGQRPGAPPDAEGPIPAEDITSGFPGPPGAFPLEFADDFVGDVSAYELSEAEEARRIELHAAAVDYWNLGFRVIPVHWMEDGRCSCGKEECGSPGKHPIDEAWQLLGPDADGDSEWWRMLGPDEVSPVNWRPAANVGIVCGQISGIIALDIDVGGEEGGDGFDTLARLEAGHPDEPIPATMIAQTGSGGRHFIFRAPPFAVSNGKPWGKSSGIDLKADRGFIVAAPSVSGFGGYRWIQNVSGQDQIAAAPSWVIEALHKDILRRSGEPVGDELALPEAVLTSYVREALDREAHIMRITPKGNRNVQLNTSAFKLGTLGAHGLLFEDEARAALEAAALAAGLPMHRIRGTFLSGWRSGLRNPRDLSRVGQISGHEWPYLPFDLIGLGDRLVVRKGDVLRYVEAWESWVHCANGAWKRCSDATPEMLAMAMIRKLWDEEKDLYPDEPTTEGETSIRAKFRAWWKTLRQPAMGAACVRAARDHPMIRATESSFDDYPFLLNVSNGIVDLTTGELIPHDPSKMMTHQAPVSYRPSLLADPLAAAPRWRAFLERVQPDEEMRAYLQRAVGYSITGSIAEQVMWLHYGSGANGKSVFHDSLSFCLGPYAQSTPVETLTAKRNDGQVPNDVARMMGRRYLLASEAKEGRRLDWPLLKQLIGGDRVAARHMRAEFFEFSPIGKFHLTTNHLPPIPNDDPAIWRRLLPLEWPVLIPEHERDGELSLKLRAEGPAILAWAVQGAVQWRKDGLCIPDAAAEAKEQYRAEEDIVGPLIGTVLKKTPPVPKGEVSRSVGHSVSEIYACAKWEWQMTGKEPMVQRSLTEALQKRGFVKTKSGGKAYFIDLQVAAPPPEGYGR